MLKLLFPTFWNVNTPTSAPTVLYRVLHDMPIAVCRLTWCCTRYVMFAERQHASGVRGVSSILSWYCVIYRDLYLTGFQMYSPVFPAWPVLMRRISRPLNYDRD
jgi:hypothetical protein